MNRMTCEECLAWLQAYLDRELDAPSVAEVEQHLRDCAGCREMFAGPEALRDCLRERLPYHAAPADLQRQILERARTHGCRGIVGRLSGRWGWAVLALAAAMLVLAALLYHAAPSSRDSLTDALVSSHIRSLQERHLTDMSSSDPDRVRQWLTGKLDFVPPVSDFAREGFALAGARLDYVRHRAAAALVYRHSEHVVNLFVLPTAEADMDLCADSRRGFNLISWRRRGLAFEAVSDLGVDDLEALGRSVDKVSTAASNSRAD